MKFDHVILAVFDLEQAGKTFSELGFTVVAGGQHAGGLTHNALVIFADHSYLELMAPTDRRLLDEPPPAGPGNYLFIFDAGEGVAGYAFHTADLDDQVARIRRVGIEIGDPESGGRRRPDGVELRWRTAMFPTMSTPFLLTDETPRELRVPASTENTAHANGATGIAGIQASVRDLAASTDRLARLFDVVPQIDRSHTSALLQVEGFEIELIEGQAGRRAELPTGLRISSAQAVAVPSVRAHGVQLVFEAS